MTNEEGKDLAYTSWVWIQDPGRVFLIEVRGFPYSIAALLKEDMFTAIGKLLTEKNAVLPTGKSLKLRLDV